MARAKRKAVRTTLFDSATYEVPRVMEYLREIAPTKDDNLADWGGLWESVRANSALGAIEKHALDLLIASGLNESWCLNYSNIDDESERQAEGRVLRVLGGPTLTPTQVARLELLATSRGVKLPNDLSCACLQKFECQLYAAAAIELQEARDRVLDGSRAGAKAAAKKHAEKGKATSKAVNAIAAKWSGGRLTAKVIAKELGEKAPSIEHISRIRKRAKK